MSFDPISAVLNVAEKVIDRVFPDPVQKAQATLELAKLQQSGELAQLTADTEILKGQLAINQEEAKNESLFVSGWRPSVGWTCSLALFAKYIGGPFLFVVAQFFGVALVLPVLDISELLALLIPLLGLAGYRTVEKIKGTK